MLRDLDPYQTATILLGSITWFSIAGLGNLLATGLMVDQTYEAD